MKLHFLYCGMFGLMFAYSFLSSTLLEAEEKISTTAQDYTIIEDKATLPILTPALSDRKTIKIRLDNGLQAMIVSDPKSDKSAASLTVDSGSWQDPEDHPGIAHFLEHMLFMGTKKFPNESEYDEFIHANGGKTNAYTASTQTSYMISVDNKAFPEGLDRFSSFFKEPLFQPSGVARELHAIDQEYAKNIDNDDIRASYVSKELGSPDHPYHHFHIGNSKTLSNTSQEVLKKWYADHYSANLMHLYVISSMPLDQLTKLVVEDFKGVPNKNAKPFNLDKPIFTNSSQENLVYIEPIQDIRTLVLLWELPKRFTTMKDSQPDYMVSSILGHEGEKSLLAQLKREELAESLESGVEKLSNDNWVFQIEIGLTDEGVHKVDDVIERVFQAISQLQKSGVPKYVFDETQQLAKIQYQYQPREDAFANVMRQTRYISTEDLSTFPEHSSIIQKFDPQAIKDFVAILTPQHAQYYLLVPSSITGIKADRKENWVGVEYALRPIAKEQLSKWSQSSVNQNIGLPDPNPFIPKDLEVRNDEAAQEQPGSYVPTPEALLKDGRGTIYYAQDTRYHVPQVHLSFEMKTPEIDMGDAQKVVLTDLFVKSVKEALANVSFSATIAGLNYSVKRAEYGIAISVDGYREHADLLLSEIMKHINAIAPTKQDFAIYKDSQLRDYQNAKKELALVQAGEIMKSILYKSFATDEQKTEALQKVSFQQFNEFVAKLFSKTYIQGMIYGNLSKSEAQKLSNIVLNSFNNNSYEEGASKYPSIVVLPNEGPFYIDTRTDVQGNAAMLAIENPDFTFKTQAAQYVIMQAIKGAFFADLRTKQQTGYLVYSYPMEAEKKLFDIFAVQSNTHEPRDLLARYELFLESYLQEITESLPEELFNSIREALLGELEEAPKNIQEMGELLQKMAFKYRGDFDLIAKRIEAFKTLTYQETLEQTKLFLGRDNKRRLAILMKGSMPNGNSLQYRPIENVSKMKDASKY